VGPEADLSCGPLFHSTTKNYLIKCITYLIFDDARVMNNSNCYYNLSSRLSKPKHRSSVQKTALHALDFAKNVNDVIEIHSLLPSPRAPGGAAGPEAAASLASIMVPGPPMNMLLQ